MFFHGYTVAPAGADEALQKVGRVGRGNALEALFKLNVTGPCISHDVALTCHVKPENVRASARQRCKSRTQTKKCRLPGAVGTTERNQFTATNDEIDTGKRRKSTERHDDTSEMNGWFGGK